MKSALPRPVDRPGPIIASPEPLAVSGTGRRPVVEIPGALVVPSLPPRLEPPEPTSRLASADVPAGADALPQPATPALPPIPPILLEGDEPSASLPARGDEPAPAQAARFPALSEPSPIPEASAPVPQLGIPIPAILLEGDGPTVPTLAGPGRKYELGSPPALEPLPAEREQLPEAYGTGALWLTARDPHCLYACWDLAPEQQRRYNALSADQHLVVRVYAHGLGAAPETEVHAHPESQHWFIHVNQAGAAYVAELGYYGFQRQWVSLAISAVAETPTADVAEDRTVRFAIIPPVPASLAALTSRPAPSAAVSPAVTSEPGRTESQAIPFTWGELPPQPELAGPPETAQPWTLEPAPVGPASPRQVALEEPVLVAVDGPESAATPNAGPQIVAAPAPAWTVAQEQALAQIVEEHDTWEATETISSVGAARRALRPGHLASLAAAQLPSPPVPAEAPSSPVEGEAVSWPGPGPGVPSRDFWFNINAELVLYGATEPTAKVTIGGRPLRLRPDGTFSCRFSLPDGEYELTVAATAAHGDRREAELHFGRRSHWRGVVEAHPQDSRLRHPAAENA